MSRRCCILVAAFLMVSVVGGSEASAALASKLTGVKRFTARLSSNRAIRKQQLIVDPEGILGGSVSTSYDPTVVRFVGIADPADFEITGGFVGTGSAGGTGPILTPLDEYLASLNRTAPTRGGPPSPIPENETGYIQIFFDRRATATAGTRAVPAGGASTIPNFPGYRTVAEDGPTGVGDTHALLFEYLPTVPENVRASYTVFAIPKRGLANPDFLIPADDPEHPIPYTELGSARVTASLASDPIDHPPAVPLPPAAWAGLATIGTLFGVRALRRK
ncbi:MAG TPA: hypothetical protein VF796_10690 [Humisphaera sp.]